jgi:hypothetical protein
MAVVNKPENTNTEKEIADLPYEEYFIRYQIFLDFWKNIKKKFLYKMGEL